MRERWIERCQFRRVLLPKARNWTGSSRQCAPRAHKNHGSRLDSSLDLPSGREARRRPRGAPSVSCPVQGFASGQRETEPGWPPDRAGWGNDRNIAAGDSSRLTHGQVLIRPAAAAAGTVAKLTGSGFSAAAGDVKTACCGAGHPQGPVGAFHGQDSGNGSLGALRLVSVAARTRGEPVRLTARRDADESAKWPRPPAHGSAGDQCPRVRERRSACGAGVRARERVGVRWRRGHRARSTRRGTFATEIPARRGRGATPDG